MFKVLSSNQFAIAAAVLFGVLGGTVCNFATQLKFLLGYDDALDVINIFSHSYSGLRD